MIEISEASATFLVDIMRGQKTGFYLDQRDNRRTIAACASGRSVLDCYAYSGAFSVHALQAGAERVTLVDSSNGALGLARRNMELNGLEGGRVEYVEGNVPLVLRSYRDARRTFDMIILDPPKFARSKSQVDKAMRAYKDINLLAMKLLNPGGLLATFSCSGGVGLEPFSEIVRWAALDAERHVQIVKRLGQAVDHPVSAVFPESEYLKGLLCRVV
jgi:23S rRNA (cytosine1962-C5)-methyltransferase